MTPAQVERIARRFLEREDAQGWTWTCQSTVRRGNDSTEWHVTFDASKDGVPYAHGPTIVVVDEQRAQARFFVTF